MRAGASGEAHGSERCRLASRQRDEHAEAEVRNRAGECPAATANTGARWLLVSAAFARSATRSVFREAAAR